MSILKITLNKKEKRNKIKTWRIITSLIITGLVLLVCGSAYFAYNNIYLTIVNANNIFLLETKLNTENVDIKTYENAIKMIELKKERTDVPEDLRNIFEYKQNSTSTIEANINIITQN